MKVENHISELLYDHDCVIVPELGGFVANYAPAKIHPVQHSFIPPSKNIVFNKNLKNNDGLLANYISTKENSPYPEALKHISQFVKTTNDELKSGKKVMIPEVGELYFDIERNIQFEPSTTNFLRDAFGLTGFTSPAIKRDNLGKRIGNEFKDREAIPAERKKINIKRYVALALAAPIIFGMLWIPLKTDLLKNVDYAGLNPFAVKTQPVYTPRTTSENIKELKLEDFTAPVFDENDTTRYITFKLTPESRQPITADMLKSEILPVEADSTKVDVVVNAPVNARFHVVAGCFQILNNAENFVITLREQHVNASIIGQNDQGLYVVSCGDYVSRKDALNDLDSLRKIQPNAWLYRD
ncbi:MAG: SPOR domain-containing protein [Bacteroidota bacterium]|nr:SPOR domain-containing protein [Bacteroidota bacterium]